MLTSIAAFAAVAALLTISPGPDFALVLRTAISADRSRAFVAACGIGLGCFCWGLASALGITALLATSRIGYDALRITGAIYLVYLGVQTLHTARQSVDAELPRRQPISHLAAFRTGLLTNLLNPKVGVVYLSLLPTFIPHGVPVLPFTLLLVAMHDAMGLLWLTAVALAVHRARRLFARAVVRRRAEQATGVALLGFGAGVAIEAAR